MTTKAGILRGEVRKTAGLKAERAVQGKSAIPEIPGRGFYAAAHGNYCAFQFKPGAGR